VTGHYGHEDSDLAVEALTAVKIAQHRVELTRPGKRPGSVCQQAHPLRERKRIELGQQPGSSRTHGRHYVPVPRT
jgi:hypothetical protein